VQKILVSNPAIGSHSYGLTDLGKEQAQKVLMQVNVIVSRSQTAFPFFFVVAPPQRKTEKSGLATRDY